MKTLHRYLTRQVLATLLMTVLVFTFVLLLGNVLKEVLELLVKRQATAGIVVMAIGLLIPFVLVFALPMGMLTATLLTFGRFSADQELTAARASGISLLSLITPILLLSLLLSGVSAWVNMFAAPQCRVAYVNLISSVRVKLISAYLPEGRIIKDFKGYIFHIGRNRDQQLRDITVFALQDETNVVMNIRAARGAFDVDTTNQVLNVRLYDGRTLALSGKEWTPGFFEEWTVPLRLDLKKRSNRPKISDMTFTQLRAELRDLEQTLVSTKPVPQASSAELRQNAETLRKKREDLLSPLRVQMHQQLATSFACFGFTLIGIPLGIRMHRRETNIGIVVALVLVFVYYAFVLTGQSLDSRPEFAPHLIVWLPNFIFQAIGIILLRKMNRGF